MSKIDQSQRLQVTCVMTKVTVGNYSDRAIEAQSKMHSKAGSALLAAMAQIQGVEFDNSGNSNPSQGPRNAVSVRTELSVENCVKLADRIAKSPNTAKYVQKREIYQSLKKQFGGLNSLTPQAKAEAMTALKQESYSYFKIETHFNLPVQVFLRKKNRRSEDDNQGTTLKTIRCLICHKLCRPGEEPTVEDLKKFIDAFLQDVNNYEWLESNEEDSSSTENLTEGLTDDETLDVSDNIDDSDFDTESQAETEIPNQGSE